MERGEQQIVFFFVSFSFITFNIFALRFAIEAEMDPSGAHREGTPSGTRSPFMKLAGYIGVGSAPQNEGENKIAMTAPVTMKKPEEVIPHITATCAQEH